MVHYNDAFAHKVGLFAIDKGSPSIEWLWKHMNLRNTTTLSEHGIYRLMGVLESVIGYTCQGDQYSDTCRTDSSEDVLNGKVCTLESVEQYRFNQSDDRTELRKLQLDEKVSIIFNILVLK